MTRERGSERVSENKRDRRESFNEERYDYNHKYFPNLDSTMNFFTGFRSDIRNKLKQI